MGCLFSKNGQVRTLSDDTEEPLPASAFSTRGAAHAWLQEIGLPQYADVFDDAGFSDWDLLSCLTEGDLDAITAHTGTRIPPGHRKKLLMASRQMGATGAQPGTPGGLAPPGGSARRYSHSSNPGNGNNSRAGGLAAAAAAAMSLERRSNGVRPNSTSRVPSLAAAAHPGLSLGLGHPPPHPLLGGGGMPSRNNTEDGLVSGRRSRAAGAAAPSRNSSRNSLSAAAAGHAIGYIASPDATGRQEAGLADPWVAAGDGAEPGSPLAAMAAAAPGGGLTPPRQRRRWSANKCASRGVLISGGAALGGGGGGAVPPSTSSYGWLETEAATSVLGGAGPITDDVRQLSVTSSIGDVLGFGAAATAGGGGGPAVHVVQPCISRDLDALVMGAGGGGNRAQSSRCQSLAARPDRSYGGGGGNGGPPASSPPPHRTSGGPSGGGAAAAQSSLLGDLPYVRGSMRQAAAAAAAAAAAHVQQGDVLHPQSQPNMDIADPQLALTQQQPRVSSARDGAASTHGAATPSAGGGVGAGGIQGSPSLRRPGSAADASHKASSSPPPPPAAALRPPTVSSYAPAVAVAAPPASPPPAPGVAWPSRGEVFGMAGPAPGAATGSAAPAAAVRQGDGDAFPPASGARGAGSPGGALPRFVRAIAGWAIPTPTGSASATPDGGGGAAAAGASPRRTRSGSRPRRTYQRQSAPLPSRPQSRAGSTIKGAAGTPAQRDRDGAAVGDVLAGAAAGVDTAAAAARMSAVAAADPSLREEARSGRSQRQMLVPDVATPRGVWDQEAALCIQGRGYKPGLQAQGVATRGPSMRRAAAAPRAGGGGGSAPGDGDSSDATPSSASRPTSAHAAAPAGTAAVAVAARGGGWPFVMPQLPLPPRASHADAQGPPSSATARAAAAGGRGGPAAVAAAAAAAADDFAPSSGSHGPPAAAAAAAMYGKLHAVPDQLSSMLLESLASDASAATNATSRRAPPAHSSRPRDWYPSGGGASEVAENPAVARAGGDADTESSADELALLGSSSIPRPHRVQIVSPAMAMAAPYHTGGGAAAGGQSQCAAAAAQWPAMPLQPPSRAKPAPPPQAALSAAGHGGGRMDVLTPEAPGLSREAQPPPPSVGGGGRASGDLPRPTPGRKLDLEMLAEQVGRIMNHLSNITEGEEAHHGGAEAGPAAAAARRDGDAGRPGGGGDAMDVQYGSGNGGGNGGGGEGGGGGGGDGQPADVVGGVASSLRRGTRLQAIDQKRLELRQLHQDLVRRVAAMASDVPPPPVATADGDRARDGRGCGAAAATEPSAADALAEVEARIRTKLTELAALTMRPDSDRRTPAISAGGATDATGGAGGNNSSAGARKRSLGPDSVDESQPAPGWDEAGCGDGAAAGGGGAAAAGRRRARDEAALHMEVLAVLGARKRQVRGAGPAPTAAAAGPAGSRSGGAETGPAGVRQPSPASVASARGPAAAAAGGGGGGDGAAAPGGGGVVLAEMHDALKAELLAIDSKIKARVLGAGAAAVSRRA